MHKGKDNLIIYVSSRNNYDMLDGEVLKNINTDGFEFINVDDNSSPEEVAKGKSICEKNNIVFLENKSRGVQMATQTLIDFIKYERLNCKWVICFQHDIYPITEDFFSILSKKVDSLIGVGIVGFNVLDHGGYTLNSYEEFKKGEKPLGMIGMCHLSIKSNTGRWLCPKQQPELLTNPKFREPFIVEFPMWAAIGINVKNWNDVIAPTDEFHFHLWLPDIAMQFNNANIACLVLPDLYCLNNQKLKIKYNIDDNSAQGAMKGNEYHFGEYSNFNAWKTRWGWDYEDVAPSFEKIKDHYNLTHIWDYYHHDMNNGPLLTYKE